MTNKIITPTEIYNEIADGSVNIKKKGNLFVAEEKKSFLQSIAPAAKYIVPFMGILSAGMATSLQAQDSPDDLKINGSASLLGRAMTERWDNTNPSQLVFDTKLKGDYNISENLSLNAQLNGIHVTKDKTGQPDYDSRIKGSNLFLDRFNLDYNNENINLKLGIFDNPINMWAEKEYLPLTGASFSYKKDNLDMKLVFNDGNSFGIKPVSEPDAGFIALETNIEGIIPNLDIHLNYIDWIRLDNNLKKTNSFSSDYNIINAGAKFKTNIAELPVGVSFNAMYNVSAEKDKFGVYGDISFGNLKHEGDFMLKLIARYIEKDAALASAAPDNTAMTNLNQYLVVAGYNAGFGKITAVYGAPERIKGNENTKHRQNFYQIKMDVPFDIK